MQRLKAANPNLKVLIYKDLSGHGRARPVGRRLDRRRHPGRRRAPRVVPAQHERPALHLPLLRLDLGRRRRQRRPTSRSGPTTCSPRWATRAGTASSWTTPTRAWSTTTTSPASPSTRPTPPTRPRPARRWRRSARASAPPASSSSRTSASGRTTRRSSTAGCAHVDGGMNENFVKVGTSAAATATTAPRCGRRSCSRSRTREAQGKLYLGVSHSPNNDARGRPLRLRDDAAGRRRQRALRDARRLHERELVRRSTTTRSARPRAPRRATRAACTGARSPTASCSSTRPTASVRGRVRRRLHRLRADQRDRRDAAARAVGAGTGQGRWWRALSHRAGPRRPGGPGEGDDGAGGPARAGRPRRPGRRRTPGGGTEHGAGPAATPARARAQAGRRRRTAPDRTRTPPPTPSRVKVTCRARTDLHAARCKLRARHDRSSPSASVQRPRRPHASPALKLAPHGDDRRRAPQAAARHRAAPRAAPASRSPSVDA